MKAITLGQVKKMAKSLSEHYTLINRGCYYVCIDKATGISSIQGGDNNLVSYHLYCMIKDLYLSIIGEDESYLDWQVNGVDIANDRKNYIFRIKYKIVNLLCGYSK